MYDAHRRQLADRHREVQPREGPRVVVHRIVSPAPEQGAEITRKVPSPSPLEREVVHSAAEGSRFLIEEAGVAACGQNVQSRGAMTLSRP